MTDMHPEIQRRWHSMPNLRSQDAGPVGLSRISVGFRSKLVGCLQRMGISTLERLDETRTDLPNRVIVRSKITLMTPDREFKTRAEVVLRRTEHHLLLEIFKNGQVILNQPRHLLRFQHNAESLELAFNARKGILIDPQPEWWLMQFKSKRRDCFLLLCWHLLQDSSTGA